MSKKNLLNETQIRHFMKLAKLEPLTPGFVSGLTERTSEDIEESHGRGKWESAAGPRDGDGSQNARNEALDDAGEELEFAADDLEGGSPEEDAEAEVDLEKAGEEEGGEGRTVAVEDFLQALESALETVLGDEVEISGEAEEEVPEEDEFAPEGDEVVADLEVDDEMELQEEAEPESEKKWAGKKGDDPREWDPKTQTKREKKDFGESTEATDDLVEQITKRVAARILKSALAKK